MKNKILKVILSLFVVLTLLLSLPIFVFGQDEIFIIEAGYYVKDPNVDTTGLSVGKNEFYFLFNISVTSNTYNGMVIYVNSSGVAYEISYLRVADDGVVYTLVYTNSGGWQVPNTIWILDGSGVPSLAETYFYNNYSFVDDYTFVSIFQSGYDGGYDEGYSEGYADGIGESYQVGYDEGYDEGYVNGDTDGFERGYDEGYNEGLNNSGNFLTDLLGNSIAAVASVFDIDIIGSFSLGDLLLAVLGVVFTMLFLKFIAGG